MEQKQPEQPEQTTQERVPRPYCADWHVEKVLEELNVCIQYSNLYAQLRKIAIDPAIVGSYPKPVQKLSLDTKEFTLPLKIVGRIEYSKGKSYYLGGELLYVDEVLVRKVTHGRRANSYRIPLHDRKKPGGRDTPLASNQLVLLQVIKLLFPEGFTEQEKEDVLCRSGLKCYQRQYPDKAVVSDSPMLLSTDLTVKRGIVQNPKNPNTHTWYVLEDQSLPLNIETVTKKEHHKTDLLLIPLLKDEKVKWNNSMSTAERNRLLIESAEREEHLCTIARATKRFYCDANLQKLCETNAGLDVPFPIAVLRRLVCPSFEFPYLLPTGVYLGIFKPTKRKVEELNQLWEQSKFADKEYVKLMPPKVEESVEYIDTLDFLRSRYHSWTRLSLKV